MSGPGFQFKNLAQNCNRFGNPGENFEIHYVQKIFHFRSVEPEFAATAGMFAAASLVTGILAGVQFSLVPAWFVSWEKVGFEWN